MGLRDQANFLTMSLREKALFILEKEAKEESYLICSNIVDLSNNSFPTQINESIKNFIMACIDQFELGDIILIQLNTPGIPSKVYIHEKNKKSTIIQKELDIPIGDFDLFLESEQLSAPQNISKHNQKRKSLSDSLQSLLDQYDVEQLITLVSNKKTVALLFVGKLKPTKPFTAVELNLLQFISIFGGNLLKNNIECENCQNKLSVEK